ncbi:hypothetical protein Y032_0157g3166 [Ancylostoma ceylanicum]|uniref:Uncharacterized protein n=1 Tax=Ancylostoma ceylanicum TaxID=53326 RepID=A0A016SYV5_9BILA|nr:hypothetical protein Y032_0157g3166 [Ancylostoma ceylanicum]
MNPHKSLFSLVPHNVYHHFAASATPMALLVSFPPSSQRTYAITHTSVTFSHLTTSHSQVFCGLARVAVNALGPMVRNFAHCCMKAAGLCQLLGCSGDNWTDIGGNFGRVRRRA